MSMISDCRNLNHYLAGFDLKFVIGADEAFDGASAKSFLIVRLSTFWGLRRARRRRSFGQCGRSPANLASGATGDRFPGRRLSSIIFGGRKTGGKSLDCLVLRRFTTPSLKSRSAGMVTVTGFGRLDGGG